MIKRKKRIKQSKLGLPPGVLLSPGPGKIEKAFAKSTLISAKSIKTKEITLDDQISWSKESGERIWMHLFGSHDVAFIQKMGKIFQLHPLVLEDMLNTDHRTKLDRYPEYLHLLLKFPLYNEENAVIETEQISIIIGSNFIVSTQESGREYFKPVYERLDNAAGRLRTQGIDYLCYVLLDIIVDQHIETMEKFESYVEHMEEKIINDFHQNLIQKIYSLKHEVLMLRKNILPMRDIVRGLIKGDDEFIRTETVVYLKDVLDHTLHMIETIDFLHYTVNHLMELCMTSLSNRMNDVMKALTLVATIFIPLTFIVGVYGMNFKYMPELEWKWSYPLVWGIMIFVAMLMIRVFIKNRWIGWKIGK